MNPFVKLGLVLALFLVVDSRAAVRDIQAQKLPPVSSLSKVLADVAELEPYAMNWSNQWRHKVPKATVVARIKADIKLLQNAVKDHPDNTELLLLTGLTAHYAYNLDVNSAYDLARQSLEKAHSLAPADIRASWFLDIHECQTAAHVDAGMRGFLQLESSTDASQTPPSFWEDYIACATVANMPAHVLRARGKVASEQRSEFTKLVIGLAEKRFVTPDPHSSYEATQVWTRTDSDHGQTFISSMCGVAFAANAEWKPAFPDVEKGTCVAQMQTGPYSSGGVNVVPNILLLVRPAKDGETLDDFFKSLVDFPNPTPITAPSCPAPHCLGYEAVARGMYKESGDGHAIVTVFERDAPQFPGIIFEEPARPLAQPDSKVHVFHPNERIRRLPGKLFYLVLLDSADSVLDRAKMDYESFLKSMQVE